MEKAKYNYLETNSNTLNLASSGLLVMEVLPIGCTCWVSVCKLLSSEQRGQKLQCCIRWITLQVCVCKMEMTHSMIINDEQLHVQSKQVCVITYTSNCT